MEVFGTTVQPFLAWLLETTLVASLVICLILILQKLLGRRLGPRWSHALWLVLLLRMVLPWTPPSPISLFSLIPTSLQRNAVRETTDGIPREDASRPADSTGITQGTTAAAPEPGEAPTEPPRPGPREIVSTARSPARPLMAIRRTLPVLWLAGVVLLGGYLVASNFALWRIIKREHPLVEQPILELFEQCKSQMGVETIVALVPSDRVRTAALFGFVRPRLLLPREMIDTASPEELRYIFLHELAHLKRHDIYLGWLTSLLQVLHWFNPLVWFAFYRMRSDRELACDALVLTRTKAEESHDYGRTMVGLLSRFSRSRPLPAMAGILESKTQLRRRIAMIAQFNNNSYRWSPLAIILIVILAFISLPEAEHARASEAAASQPATQPKFTEVHIPSKISWDAQLSPDGTEIAFGSEDKLWIATRAGKLRPDYAGMPRPLDTGGIPVERVGFAWSRDGRWIAFTDSRAIKEEGRKGNQRIYIVPATGGEARQVHETNRHSLIVNYQMGLSPNGKTLAFSSFDAHEIYLETISVDGGSPKRLVGAPAREPAFSPDGRTIAYVENKKMGVEGGGLWTVPAEGGASTLVADANNASSPIWSPDGSMIAFIDTGMGNQIYIVGVEKDGKPTGEKFKVDPPDGTVGVGRLAGWTPDNEIGVICAKKVETALYTQPVQGGKATFLAIGGGAQPRWSPDGKRVYHTNRADEAGGDWKKNAIAYVPALGGDVMTVPITSKEKITIWAYGAGNRVSPDGTTIVFAGQGEEENLDLLNIWTLPVEGGEPKRLTHPPAGFSDWYPCWSHDGQDIVFVREKLSDDWASRQDGEIYIVSARGGEPRKITWESDRVYSAGPVVCSPDGKWLAFYSRDKDKVDGALCVTTPNGGELRTVAAVESIYANKELAWSPDSKRIAFHSTKERVIKIVSLEDGGIEEIEVDLVHTNIYHLDWSPDGKNLVFAGYSGGGREFWMVENFLPEAPVAKPEPTPTLRQIEVRSRGSVHSQPSPDGRHMTDVDDTGNLIVRELVTGKQWKLTEKEPGSKDFAHGSLISPDSTRVAYYWLNAEKEDFHLRVVGLDGSNDRLLWAAEDGARSFNMRVWSPDGTHIFGEFLGKDEPVRLIRVSADDGSRDIIKTFDRMRFFTVDISPDGRYAAYDVADGEASNRDILVLDLEGNRETPLVTHPANDKLLGWTPDGRHIFFASDRNGTWDGWLLQVDDGTPRGLPEMIKAGLGDVSPVGFTRSGAFYYQFRHQGWNVYVARLDPDTGEVRSEPDPVRLVGKDMWPDWSPDGQYLAYCAEPDRNKAQIIRIRTLATGQERELKPDLPRFHYVRWCPDSRHLLITNFGRESPSVVYQLDAATGEYTPLVQSDQPPIRQAELSADGKTLAYRIRGLGTMNRLMVRDLETGNEKEVLQTPADGALALAPGSGWALSPDGKHVALSIREDAGKPFVLKIMAVESGECRTLDGEQIFQIAWTPDGRDLLVTKNVRELWRVSAETGEPQKLLEWKGMIMGPRIHPDGQRLAFFSGARMSELWVMENFLPAAVARALQ